MAKKLTVQGITIRLEKIDHDNYVSLTDIAKYSEQKPATLINSWMRNSNTLLFLEAWEKVHNPNFKVSRMTDFRLTAQDKRYSVSTQKYIEATGAIGLIAKSGRYGGTYACSEIALDFCAWLSPQFKVYLYKEFERLKREEFNHQGLEWHVRMITDRIEDVRNLLDTIPGQDQTRNRLNYYFTEEE